MPRPRPAGAWATRSVADIIATTEASRAPRTRFRTPVSLTRRRGPPNRFRSALRCVGLARRREQALAGRCERHDARIADVRTVLGLRSFDGDLVADVQRAPRPALAHQAVGAAHFHAPVDDFSVVTGDIHVEVGVRIRPLDLRDNALQIDGLVRVEFGGERMVRDDPGRRERETDDRGKQGDFHSHARPPQTNAGAPRPALLGLLWELGLGMSMSQPTRGGFAYFFS